MRRNDVAICISSHYILIHAPTKDATSALHKNYYQKDYILIHAPTKDATAKSHKIVNNFAALFRKFIQKLGIAIFTISIFLEK